MILISFYLHVILSCDEVTLVYIQFRRVGGKLAWKLFLLLPARQTNVAMYTLR